MSNCQLHWSLRNCDYNADDIKILLEQDASFVNKRDPGGDMALKLVLMNPRCSVDIVKLLIGYGTDVNMQDRIHHLGLLNIALMYSKDANAIELLLKHGADVNTICCGRTTLHFALGSDRKKFKHTLDILKLLLPKVDVNKVDNNGRSPLCLALKNQEAPVIQLLLDAGARMNACEYHVSPLHCYLHKSKYLNVVAMTRFLDVGADINKVDEKGNLPIHLALRYANCGVSDIKFLLYEKDVAINIRNGDGGTLLHCAVQNDYCKVSILKFLIQRGACDDSVTNIVCNPLHLAAGNLKCGPSVLKMFLGNYSLVVGVNELGYTPLQIAVSEFIRSVELDKFARSITLNLREYFLSSLKQPYIKYEKKEYKEDLQRIKLILKYFLLQRPDFRMEEWTEEIVREYYAEVSGFARECAIELQGIMELEHDGSDFSLLQFLGVPANKAVIKHKSKDDEFNQLLKILENNKFPVYLEVILAKVGRSFMNDKLQELAILNQMGCSELPCIEKKVILDYTSVLYVADFLPDNALLNLILAFHNTEFHTACGHSNENHFVVQRKEVVYNLQNM